MEKALLSCLVELAANPGQLAEYLGDREAFLEGAGLSAEARDAILSGDQDRIAALAGAHETMFTWEQYRRKKDDEDDDEDRGEEPGEDEDEGEDLDDDD